MNRAQLYHKFQALTDQPVARYFRSSRLLKAKTLLLAADLHVSEIAFEVGLKTRRILRGRFWRNLG